MLGRPVVLSVIVAAASLGAAGAVGLDDIGTCGGMAPVQAVCTTGEHLAGNFLIHGPRILTCSAASSAAYCFVGTIISRVQGSSDAQEVTCVVVALDVVDSECAVSGRMPGDFVVEHTCRVEGLGPLRSAPGLGEWGCFVHHD